MTDASTTGWFPVFTLVLGFAASSINEWLRDSRAARREREARNLERREQLRAKRASFETETLLELQEAVARLVRASGAAHHLDTMAEKSTGTWGRNLLPDSLDEEYRASQARTSILTVRVRDDVTRELVAALRDASSKVAVARNRQDAVTHMQEMSKLLDSLNERIGQVFRALGDE